MDQGENAAWKSKPGHGNHALYQFSERLYRVLSLFCGQWALQSGQFSVPAGNRKNHAGMERLEGLSTPIALSVYAPSHLREPTSWPMNGWARITELVWEF